MIPSPVSDRLDGFRGAFILVLSIPWIVVGWSYITTETTSRARAFSYLPDWLNENELGWVWILVGAFLFVCAALGQEHPKWTTIGFIAGLVPPTLWAVVFLVAWVLGTSTTANVSVFMYGTIAVIIYFCSGWPNPPRASPQKGDSWES